MGVIVGEFNSGAGLVCNYLFKVGENYVKISDFFSYGLASNVFPYCSKIA